MGTAEPKCPTFDVHPLAELIPPMSDEEYRELREDIEANGYRADEPTTLYEGKILDGRHRARVCEELGIFPPTRNYDGNDPEGFVISKNVHRRHLTPTERGLIALKRLPKHKADAKRRQDEGRERSHASRRGELGSGQESGTNDDADTTKRTAAGSATPTPGEAHHAAGAEVGVSGKTVARLDKVAQEAPDLLKEVETGQKTASAAARTHAERSTAVTDKAGRKQPATYFGKGDKWKEFTEPLTRYLAAWEKRGYEFAHINYREATKRVKRIDNLIAGLEAARADLEPRTQKAKLTL
jgi:hypothetical protein